MHHFSSSNLEKTLAVFFTALLCIVSLSPGQAQEVRRTKLGHSFSDDHPRSSAMKFFASQVANATSGKIVIDVYGNSSLGSEEKMLTAVQSGVQDIYMGSLAPISVRKKEMQIFDFPFLFGSDAEAAHVLDGAIGSKMLASLSDMQLHGLVWSGGAFRNMSNSKRPVRSVAEMSGLKVRVMQSPMAIASFKAMGMNAVPMAFTEVYPALETKALDGYEHPFVDMYANKMYEVQKYLTVTNHVYTPVAIVASSKWWASLTSDQRAVVQKAAQDTRSFQRAEELRQGADVVNQLRNRGMSVAEMPSTELDKIRATVQPVIDQSTANIGADFVQSFYTEIKKFRVAK
jgi:TRAP-type transport system periplasmic protein